MGLWQKIKNFFKRGRRGSNIKRLTSGNIQMPEEIKTQDEDIMQIYKEVKQGKRKVSSLTEAQLQSVAQMLKVEKIAQKEKLDKTRKEVHKIQKENQKSEKQRLLDMYTQMQNNTLDLKTVSKRDLEKMLALQKAEYANRKQILQQEQEKEEAIRKEIKKLQDAI